jgi:hypothetical protein
MSDMVVCWATLSTCGSLVFDKWMIWPFSVAVNRVNDWEGGVDQRCEDSHTIAER